MRSPLAPILTYPPTLYGPEPHMGSWLSSAFHAIFGGGAQDGPPTQAQVDAEVAKLQAASPAPAAAAAPSIGGVPMDQAIMLGGFALAVLLIATKRPT